MNKHIINRILCLLCCCLGIIILFVLYLYNIIPHARFTANDFNIETMVSNHDEDQDGIDDFTDILLGVKAEIRRDPKYHSAYYEGGYPPEDEGVCTDVIWRSLRDAGYDLKTMMDEDIKANVHLYPRVGGTPDPNIDFRRVPNIQVFLSRHSQSLTLDVHDIKEWQPGDIVVFSDTHIGIISDIRNHKGIPFILHNGDLPVQEEDALQRENYLKGISGHYRFILK